LTSVGLPQRCVKGRLLWCSGKASAVDRLCNLPVRCLFDGRTASGSVGGGLPREVCAMTMQ
jgi:hypothetical protein